MKLTCREKINLLDVINDLKIEIDDIEGSYPQTANGQGIKSLKSIVNRLELMVNEEEDNE